MPLRDRAEYMRRYRQRKKLEKDLVAAMSGGLKSAIGVWIDGHYLPADPDGDIVIKVHSDGTWEIADRITIVPKL